MMKIADWMAREGYDYKAAGALLLIVLALVGLTNQIRSIWHLKPPSWTFNLPKLTSQQPALNANSALFKSSLFGEYMPEQSAAAEIKQSRLAVDIVGVLFSKQASESQVIIRVSGGEERSFVVGDTLSGGAVIKQITEKGIIVLYQGQLESLSLPKNDLTFDPPAQPLIREK